MKKIKNMEMEMLLLKKELKSANRKNRDLSYHIEDLNEYCDEIEDYVEDLSKQNDRTNQYTRRENIEIMNIPENIKQEDLENTVIDIMAKMKMTVEPNNFIAVHRLKKKSPSDSANVIVRLNHRKITLDALRRKKLLKGTGKKLGFKRDPIIIENLCPNYQQVYDECRLLVEHGELHRVWTYNGNVTILKYENSLPLRVFSLDDIYDIL